MKFRRYLVPLIVIAAFIFVVAPASAAWGAHWGSGSVIGEGTVTGLKNAQKNGATVLATISAYGATLSNGTFTGPGGLPGVVWCVNPGSNHVVPGVNPVTLRLTFSGPEFVDPSHIAQTAK